MQHGIDCARQPGPQRNTYINPVENSLLWDAGAQSNNEGGSYASREHSTFGLDGGSSMEAPPGGHLNTAEDACCGTNADAL